jgi:sulfoxide reductase heme-binding subunit YedZ
VHLTSDPALWYAARASGVAAYVALTAVVALGLGLGGKARLRYWPRFAVEDVHRFGGLLVGSLIGIHVVAIAVDSFLPFSLTELFVPFTGTYRPLWTGLGIAAMELLLALAITNRYRSRLPYRFWRRAHYVNFAVWTLASLHTLMGGTDRGATWLAIIYAVSVAIVAMLLLWRFAGVGLRSRAVATTGGVIAFALPLLLIAVFHNSSATRSGNAAHVDESLTGKVVSSGGGETQVVSFVGRAGRSQELLVRADLLVSGGQSVEKTSLQLEYLGSGDVCRGRVTKVGGTGFSGSCRLPDGESRSVDASWQTSNGGASVAGTIELDD